MRHDKRQTDFSVARNTPYWAQSQVSLAKDSVWLSPGSDSYFPEASNGDVYRYTYDSVSAMDTYVYMLREDGIWNGTRSSWVGTSSTWTLSTASGLTPPYGSI
ncbi:hypothetical protein N7471_000257 [Penicillium samsonianum]|uniref:uncharacterized protein n=1 Tax=Penicillium samsonianum TaxID=1882272 RepID=UPI0025484826|nr:uncharacterized protein N7471_000257 [Penicillium samsonianum]KAJ6149058.1 hypothetical protein N7471_000257 [Penicillium samsonianum]